MPYDTAELEGALHMVGQLLDAAGHRYNIVVIGGAALNMALLVRRATTDVDILAFAVPDADGTLRLRPPDEPLPEPLHRAARTVAADRGLDPNWLNTGPAGQWRTGLPPGIEADISWKSFGGLNVGLVGRRTLIYFKLYAAADDTGPQSVHFQDLLALAPNDAELRAAQEWVCQQDPSTEFATVAAQVAVHVRQQRPSSH